MEGAQASGSDEVVVVEKGELLLVNAKRKPDLTKHFDSVVVGVDPKDFSDYSSLKKAVLGRGRR